MLLPLRISYGIPKIYSGKVIGKNRQRQHTGIQITSQLLLLLVSVFEYEITSIYTSLRQKDFLTSNIMCEAFLLFIMRMALSCLNNQKQTRLLSNYSTTPVCIKLTYLMF